MSPLASFTCARSLIIPASLCLGTLLGFSGVVHAADVASNVQADSGAASESLSPLQEAELAWSEARLDEALTLYESILKGGGLEPFDVVLAYARIGTVKAALGDKTGALSAFRVASVVDPEFVLPNDSGKIAAKLYGKAKQQSERHGSRLSLTLHLPEDRVASGTPFGVAVEIPEGFSVFVDSVAVTVRDSLGAQDWTQKDTADGRVVLRFPGEAAVAGGNMLIEARALDADGNAWALEQGTLRVGGVRQLGFDGWGSGNGLGQTPGDDSDSFFMDNWPWFAGGAAAVATSAVLFVLLQPTDVSVGSPRWETR